MFLENEEEIKEMVKEYNNTLFDLSKKTQRHIITKSQEENGLTFNCLDKIKLQESRQIIRNIEREKEYCFEYEKPKEKQLTN